MKIKVKIEELE